MSYRGQSFGHTNVCLEQNMLFSYTDGSADNPISSETRRAAWSVVQFAPASDTSPYLTIKLEHVSGQQSISRAELAAVAWIVQHTVQSRWTQQVIITTDSQYVIDTVNQVVNATSPQSWHRLAHADLRQIIQQNWNSQRFQLRKVRAHQNVALLPPGPDRHDAVGNMWADMAAVRVRHSDNDRVDSFVNKAQEWHHETRAILKYLADLNLEHAQLKQLSQQKTRDSQAHDPTQDWGTLFRLREKYNPPGPVQQFNPDIHPTFIVACLWGNQFVLLIWLDPTAATTHDVAKVGITWHELTIAFIVNTGVQFRSGFVFMKISVPARTIGKIPKYWPCHR